MSTARMNPKMKVADLNQIARLHGLRIKLTKIDCHTSSAFTALDKGQHEVALEHLRAASALIDEAEAMRCAA